MLSFLQNQWVVGSGTGIISGIIVYFITKWAFQRKDNSKYFEQIDMANDEIIRTLKPYIAEKGLPEKEIIDAIILSTARKFKVKGDELYSIRIICEELIKEIIENVYVSSDKKQEFSRQLKDYLYNMNAQQDKEVLISIIEKDVKNSENQLKEDYKKRLTSTLSLMISMLATVLTAFSVLFLDKSDEFSLFPISNYGFDSILIASIVSLTTVCISFILIYAQKIGKDTKRKERNKDNKDNKL